MQAEFKRENHKSYFVIRDSRLDSDEHSHEVYDLEMLCENQMQGILPVSLHSLKEKQSFIMTSAQNKRYVFCLKKRCLHGKI